MNPSTHPNMYLFLEQIFCTVLFYIIAICPTATVAYEGNCFWSERGMRESVANANNACAERGGTLAALPGPGSMGFLHYMWWGLSHVINKYLTCIKAFIIFNKHVKFPLFDKSL